MYCCRCAELCYPAFADSQHTLFAFVTHNVLIVSDRKNEVA